MPTATAEHAGSTTVTDPHVRIVFGLLDELFGDLEPRDFSVRLWDGSTWGPQPGQPARFTLVVRDPGVIRRLIERPSTLSVGEAYLVDEFDVEGDAEYLFAVVDRILAEPHGTASFLRVARTVSKLPKTRPARIGRAATLGGRAHTKKRDRSAIQYHYDVGNDFYSLWLDERMVYSCAYFESPDDDLETAQLAKLDHICRKLRLAPGERLLDIGCGWGGLLMRAASGHGVEAVGITLSEQQAQLARQRIAEAGLQDRCKVEVRDYRDVDDWGGFDKIVSVGMFEHVGRARLEEYFERAFGLLKPGGAFLNHGIASSPVRSSWGTPLPQESDASFIQRYVFPDGELVPISVTLAAAEKAGFDVRDVESLREHYAVTLRHWVARLEDQQALACEVTDEVTYRVWRAFMAACAHAFASGSNTVYQTLLVRAASGGHADMPLTRADWYA